MKLGDIVKVTWDDHTFVYGDELFKAVASRAVTIGKLVQKDKSGLVVSLTNSGDRPHELQFIDRRMIVKAKKLS